MNCIPLDKLIDQWSNTDSVIDSAEPGKELLRIPILHAKYVGQMAAHRASLKMKKFEFFKLRKLRIDYYSGRLTKEELEKRGWEQFKFVLKTDMASYLEADPNLIDLQQKMINNEEAVDFCQSVCKELSNRTWQLRDYMQWEKFISGQ